jgi:DNA-binding GntR family transcriptional regulator
MKPEIIVQVQGHGTFIISADKVTQLIAYLQTLKAVGVNENAAQYGGETLLRG